jgi:hypothetical protein
MILAPGGFDTDLAAESNGLDGLLPVRILDPQLEIQKGRHGKPGRLHAIHCESQIRHGQSPATP